MSGSGISSCRHEFSRGLAAAGMALGFGLGGFFDGILLHQVLQWHHLLSGIEQARLDIRFLILTDGLFHLVMYLVAGLGLGLLWRERKHFAAPDADRRLLASALIGFGGWHALDAILSHWVLGIHRIRMDVDNPLFWDLLWLALFGIVPIFLGVFMGRGGSGPVRTRPMLVLAVVAAGALTFVPNQEGGPVMVLFRPDITPVEAYAALRELDARIIWTEASNQLWAVDVPDDRNTLDFYRYGALMVSNAIPAAGCLAWIEVA